MNPEQNSRRRFINAAAMTMGGMSLQACGGGGSDSAVQADAAAAATTNAEALRAVRQLPPSKMAPVTTLTVTSVADGSRNFAASVFPLEGQVPAGSTLASPDDGTLSCSVLTRWNDGSAALMVVAGTSLAPKGQTATLRLQLFNTADIRVGNLNTDAVAKVVRSVKLDLGVLGTVEQTNFQNP